MQAIVLMTALATLGVEWDERKLEDNRNEYVLLVEPKNLQLLAEGGGPITSSVPDVVTRIDRLMIRIGTQFPREGSRIAADTFDRADMRLAGEEFAQAVVYQDGQAAASRELSYGWKPGLNGQVDFLVQISPTLLAQLRDGNELYVPTPPQAGKIGQFVISTGVQQLLRVGAGQDRFGAEPNPRFASSQPTRLGGDPPNDFRAPPGGLGPSPTTFGPPAPEPAGTGRGAFAAEDASSRRSPFAPGDAAQTQFAAQPGGGFGAPANTAERPPTPSSSSLFPGGNNPPQPGFAAASSPAGPPSYASQPPGREMGQNPASGAFPTGNFPAGNPPPGGPGFNNATTANFGQLNGPMNGPAGTLASRDPRAAPPMGAFPPAGAVGPGLATAQPNYPWVWTMVFLMASIGFNLWTGWTAWEYYSRYRLAVERLRSTSAPRG